MNIIQLLFYFSNQYLRHGLNGFLSFVLTGVISGAAWCRSALTPLRTPSTSVLNVMLSLESTREYDI